MPTTIPLEGLPQSYAAMLRFVPGDATPRARTVDRRTIVVIASPDELPLAYVEYRRARVLTWLPGGSCMIGDGGLPRTPAMLAVINNFLPAGYELEMRGLAGARDWVLRFPNHGEALLTHDKRTMVFRPDAHRPA